MSHFFGEPHIAIRPRSALNYATGSFFDRIHICPNVFAVRSSADCRGNLLARALFIFCLAEPQTGMTRTRTSESRRLCIRSVQIALGPAFPASDNQIVGNFRISKTMLDHPGHSLSLGLMSAVLRASASRQQ